MNPFDPFDLFNLRGRSTMRNVTLALPIAEVQKFLPAGLELGPQKMTDAGRHPVILSFNDVYDLRPAFPTFLPGLTYHEHVVGIPYCHVKRGVGTADSPGPYYFMPTLLLDDVLATLGGVVFWGYPKRLARITESGNAYQVQRRGGEPLVSLALDVSGDFQPVGGFAKFTLQREALSQPLIGMMPLSVGPCFVVADFPKRWSDATARPLKTVTVVETSYVTGLSKARHPAKGKGPGIDQSVIGSYELDTHWSMSMPYPPFRM